MSDAILSLERISKTFFGIHALRDVSLTLGRGRVVGLIGQNGAGKSTLMNVIGGVVRPDSGGMVLDGLPYTPQNPAHASRAGIAFIHQELNLFSNLSIAENIFIDRFPHRRFGPLASGRSASHACPRAQPSGAGRSRSRARNAGRAAVSGRTPTGRGRQGAAARRPNHHIRRADHVADRARNRAAVRPDRAAAPIRQVDDLHFAYPRRRHARGGRHRGASRRRADGFRRRRGNSTSAA